MYRYKNIDILVLLFEKKYTSAHNYDCLYLLIVLSIQGINRLRVSDTVVVIKSVLTYIIRLYFI